MLLEAKELVKSFKNRKVVQGVSFYVNPGEIVGLLGPNGAGKTTSFRMTVGMLAPESGDVLFQGKIVTYDPMYRRARIGMGYLSQEPSIFKTLTVKDNIMAILENLPLRRRERRARLGRLLSELGLEKLAQSKAQSLSGGERRRLEITRALVTEPRLLLLDEPFSGVDPIAVADIQDIIVALKQKGMGILLTDHNVRETLSVTDRSYIISEGTILVSGTSAELVNNQEARRIYLGEKFNMPEFMARDRSSMQEELLHRGIRFYREHDYLEAIRVFGEIISNNPNYEKAINCRGITYVAMARHEDALRDFGDTVRLSPSTAKNYFYRGVANFYLGQVALAREDLNKSKQLQPDLAEADAFLEEIGRMQNSPRGELAYDSHSGVGKTSP